MNLLIKNARVIDPNSPFNSQSTDIFIENGIIKNIGKNLTGKADKEISIDGLCVSPGWVDMFANFADPGYEYKESIESGCLAAAAGGFTDVLVIPNTKPAIDAKSQVEYIVQKSRSLTVSVHPIGAVTKNAEGKELAEMYDMKTSGAIAFGDGLNCIQSSGLLVKALQYVKAFDGMIIQLPDDKSINEHGLMHEGIISTQIGLPGKPAMAEEIIVARDIKLARYAESNLHFTGVSSKKSLEYIERGKKGGTHISCSVTPYHLYFTDEDLKEYDSNLKVNPPLRSAEDREALKKAIQDGTVDCIATHHLPHEADSKETEFEYAKNGMTGLETAYSVLKTTMPEISEEKAVALLSTNPRILLKLNACTIKENEKACLTLFCPNVEWIYEKNNIQSRSKNSPFIGKKFTGKVIGIINKDQVHLNP
ncbi:MAG: dihydroorotase [Bacteroidetes bacterium]|nr:MAG: dihydroorotase [Bacteroidota bacterium]